MMIYENFYVSIQTLSLSLASIKWWMNEGGGGGDALFSLTIELKTEPIHEPFHSPPLHIVPPSHHSRPPMTSGNHFSFGVESSDCQIRPRGSSRQWRKHTCFSLKVTHDLTIIEYHLLFILSKKYGKKCYIKHTILSASMIVCNRWATVMTVTSELISCRKVDCMTESVL